MYQKFETICLEVEDIMYQVCFLVIKKKNYVSGMPYS